MKQENTIKYNHHLYDLILHLKTNAKKFSESLGHNRTDRVYNVLKGKNNITPDLANEIINVYPDVKFEWLITGRGDMLIGKTESVSENEKKIPFSELPVDQKLNLLFQSTNTLIEIVEKQEKKIDALIKDNIEIKEHVNDNLFFMRSRFRALLKHFNVHTDKKDDKHINEILKKIN